MDWLNESANITVTFNAVIAGIILGCVIVLWGIFKLIHRAARSGGKSETAVPYSNAAFAADFAGREEDEHIAVIAAAVAVMLGGTSGGLRIKSIKRAGDGSPVWNSAGRHDLLRNALQ
ncbi:MAG: hypothetical protein LBH54_01940 [Clostridiales bacterium]|jgi:hypothetical protein|nr:hypothetical protein [Clostridiales bacterium]